MFNRLSNLAAVIGVGIISLNTCLYTVDPG
jgi:hypothetical protein